jgi:alpha-L-fucosidase
MKRRTFVSKLGASAATGWLAAAAPPAAKPAAPPRFGDGRDWFHEKRFGMFVHWGLYSIPAWHEQHQWRAKVPRAEYGKLRERWNPAKFDPDQWLDLLQEAGMEYLTLTTKHHDGFCLFESRHTDFHTVNTPFKKDIVGLVADACHKRNIPLCLYYSIADWHHPNYPNQGRHHELPRPEAGDRPDWPAYLDFLKAQVRELCTNYGEIHGLWWDMNVPEHKDPSINAMVRQLQPKAVINNRGFDDGDFGTPERDYKSAVGSGFHTRVEACQAVGSESWGFRTDEDYYTLGHLERSIDRFLARGANYLLNVGPTAEGLIDDRSAAILRDIGKWFKTVRESYHGTEQAGHLSTSPKAMLTRRGNDLYVHLNQPLETDAIKLPPFTVAPRKATLLNDGRPLETSTALCPPEHQSGDKWLRVRGIPADAMANTVPVIKLEFDRPLEQCLGVKKDMKIDP